MYRIKRYTFGKIDFIHVMTALTGDLWITTRLLIFVSVDIISSNARGFEIKLGYKLHVSRRQRLSLEDEVEGRNSLFPHVPYLGLFFK